MKDYTTNYLLKPEKKLRKYNNIIGIKHCINFYTLFKYKNI